jgi:hypothetical protein
MDLDKLWKELLELKKHVRELQEGITRLEQGLLGGEMELQRSIKARGIEIHRQNPGDALIFSADASAEELTLLYQLLRHYSFRLFLRDAISKKDGFRAHDLVRYCSLEAAERYIAFLCQLQIAETIGEGAYRLHKRSLSSFGPTLEWFVSQIFQREFASPALYGVRFKETCMGGDYDVIALWQGRLVYVEIKSSPPRGIERGEIGSFLARQSDLLPDIAFLFNDTQLRMKDKIVLMFEEELSERFGASSCDRFPVHRLVDELFHINHRIYIVNSKRDVVDNFNLCLRDFLIHQRMDLLPIVPPQAD